MINIQLEDSKLDNDKYSKSDLEVKSAKQLQYAKMDIN